VGGVSTTLSTFVATMSDSIPAAPSPCDHKHTCLCVAFFSRLARSALGAAVEPVDTAEEGAVK